MSKKFKFNLFKKKNNLKLMTFSRETIKNRKRHFQIPYLEFLNTNFEVGYLYEFVVEFSNILHSNFSF